MPNDASSLPLPAAPGAPPTVYFDGACPVSHPVKAKLASVLDFLTAAKAA